jgi:hypothetical protein
MTRTTPPRPVDIAAVLPALARTATRLHPRPATPTPQDSSVGGPLLWPADEPWPYCRAEDHYWGRGSGPTVVSYSHDKADDWEPDSGPVPMVPLAQLYVRDVPGVRPPEGADLLQVLWCPLEHDSAGGLPTTALFWRTAAAVADVLTDPPEPDYFEPDLVPEPCTIHPEQVIEYPNRAELEEELERQVSEWALAQIPGSEYGLEYGANPYDLLCIAPGLKIGGYVDWGMTDPYPNPCPTCGAETEPLLTIASQEWGSHNPLWVPYEDWAADVAWGNVQGGPNNPMRISISDANDQIIRVCTASHEHPHVQMMQ